MMETFGSSEMLHVYWTKWCLIPEDRSVKV